MYGRRMARRKDTMKSFLPKVGLPKGDRDDLGGELMFLINYGADLDRADGDGNCLIHLVVRGSEDSLFRILVDRAGIAGAAAIDLNAVDALEILLLVMLVLWAGRILCVVCLLLVRLIYT